MRSNASPRRDAATQPAELAARLAAAIEECAAAARAGNCVAGPDLTARLASAWAMLAAADPELAARIARYAES